LTVSALTVPLAWTSPVTVTLLPDFRLEHPGAGVNTVDPSAALLIPAMLGAPGSLDETSALMMLGEAFLVAGIAVFLGLLAPASWRPLAGAGALGTQYSLLWILGRGPVLGPDGGVVVPLSAVFLLALTASLTVLTPLAALFSRRFFQTVEEEGGGPRPARAPAKGARREDGG
jgi:hypothetical protein